MKTRIAVIISTAIISAMATTAHTATRCVALNENTTCSNGTYSYDRADWSTTCTTNGTDFTIHGLGICTNHNPEQYTTANNLSIHEGSNYIHCWCRIISPAISDWIYLNNKSDEELCSEECARDCAFAHPTGYPMDYTVYLQTLISTIK